MRTKMAPNVSILHHVKGEVDLEDAERCIDLLQYELRVHLAVRGTFSEIADFTDLSASTVRRMHYGKSRYPRNDTVLRMLTYFGYRIYARKVSNT